MVQVLGLLWSINERLVGKEGQDFAPSELGFLDDMIRHVLREDEAYRDAASRSGHSSHGIRHYDNG